MRLMPPPAWKRWCLRWKRRPSSSSRCVSKRRLLPPYGVPSRATPGMRTPGETVLPVRSTALRWETSKLSLLRTLALSVELKVPLRLVSAVKEDPRALRSVGKLIGVEGIVDVASIGEGITQHGRVARCKYAVDAPGEFRLLIGS